MQNEPDFLHIFGLFLFLNIFEYSDIIEKFYLLPVYYIYIFV